MNKIFKYVISDILRNRIVVFYMLLLLGISLSIFSLEDNPSKGMLSMLNTILLIVPLFSIVFSTIYMYNSAEFVELLLSQPLKRSSIWLSLFLGLVISLVIAFLAGAGFIIVFFVPTATGILLVVCGLLLTLAFSSLAMFASVMARDKAKGIGITILVWLYFAMLFDGLVMFMLFQFSDYPIERYMVMVSMLNPIDLARILILMQLDVSALMGYTGAVFKDFFGTQLGLFISFAVLLLWTLVPLLISLRKFIKKDI